MPINSSGWAYKLLSLFLISSATLLFEIDLSRLFSVAQFYHFAFLVVSLALLGYGASGTALAMIPKLVQKATSRSLAWLAIGCGFSIAGGYLLTNSQPVDSFSIAWDPRQALLLTIDYLALTLPFFFSGLAAGLLIAASPRTVGGTYAANLIGASVGCLTAWATPAALGGEGAVMLASGLAFLAAVCAWMGSPKGWRKIEVGLAGAGLLFALGDLVLRLGGLGGYSFLRLQLSPYKSLSALLQQPGTTVESSHWNAFSRVDLVSSPQIHSFPGLSYRFLQPLPAQKGLLVDGDDLSPVLEPGADMQFSAYLPGAIAYQLRPQAKVLILGAGGGLDALSALAQGAGQVDAVEANELLLAASPAYSAPHLQAIHENERTYLRNSNVDYDVIVLALNTPFRPIRSGAYSLSENYRFTQEAFTDMLNNLNENGIVVVTCWLQDPPSEDLRTFALAVATLEQMNLEPAERLVAFRGYNTATFLIKTRPFTEAEMITIRRFTDRTAFDLIHAPGLLAEETNRYNILTQPVYYQTYQALLATDPRQTFFEQYPFDVSPPEDDRPFSGHFFKWSQVGQVLAEIGKTWQPFGGAGYFILLLLLAFTVIAAAGLILLPLSLRHTRETGAQPLMKNPKGTIPLLWYFGLIGFAYLLVEIPLIQKFILFLGQPTYAMTAVLFTLLLFSGLGSLLGKHIPNWLSMALLVLSIISMPLWLPALFQLGLGASLTVRLMLTILTLAPVGFMMGIPFQAGIREMDRTGISGFIPWAWAINGSTSVISAVLAALLALTFGFTRVLQVGALCYLAAFTLILSLSKLMAARAWESMSLHR